MPGLPRRPGVVGGDDARHRRLDGGPLVWVEEGGRLGRRGHDHFFLASATARMMMTPRTTCCWLVSSPARISPLLIRPISRAPNEGADHGAGAAEQAGAAEDHRRDGGQLVAGAPLEAARLAAGRRRACRHSGDQHGGDQQHLELDPLGVDAGELGGRPVAAGGQHLATEAGLGQADGADGDERSPSRRAGRGRGRSCRHRRSGCRRRSGSAAARSR